MAKFILFDTETTGTEDADRVVQVGAMIVDSDGSVEVYDELCLAPIPIKIEAMEIHNITNEMLEGKPAFVDTAFYAALTEHNNTENCLVAHNLPFDLKMIKKEGFEENILLIDTLRCSRHLIKESPHHRLQFLRYYLELYKTEEAEAEKLGVTIKAHDAIGDVLVMKLFLSKLFAIVKEKFPQDNPVSKLIELTKTPVLVETFKFGKYKGENIADIYRKDSGYIRWMRSNMDLDEDMIYTLDTIEAS